MSRRTSSSSSTKDQRTELKHKQKFHTILSRSLCWLALTWFLVTSIACCYSILKNEIDTKNIPLVLVLFGLSVGPVIFLLWFSYTISQKQLVKKQTSAKRV